MGGCGSVILNLHLNPNPNRNCIPDRLVRKRLGLRLRIRIGSTFTIMKILIVLLTVCAAWAGQAQTTNAPRTYFDAYKSALDAPLVRGMSSIGALTGQVAYPVEIKIERLNVQPTTNTLYAVAMRTHLARNVVQTD